MMNSLGVISGAVVYGDLLASRENYLAVRRFRNNDNYNWSQKTQAVWLHKISHLDFFLAFLFAACV